MREGYDFFNPETLGAEEINLPQTKDMITEALNNIKFTLDEEDYLGQIEDNETASNTDSPMFTLVNLDYNDQRELVLEIKLLSKAARVFFDNVIEGFDVKAYLSGQNAITTQYDENENIISIHGNNSVEAVLSVFGVQIARNNQTFNDTHQPFNF